MFIFIIKDETRILVSHQQRSDRMEVEGSLDISNLVSSDAGVYICKATNEAKSVEQTATLTVQCKCSVVFSTCDAGVYICKATNKAKSVEQSAQLKVQCKCSL